MENWEKILRQSDEKVRDFPPKPENWDRLARELANLPPGGTDSPPPGSAGPGLGWLGGSVVTVAVLAVASYGSGLAPAVAAAAGTPLPITEISSPPLTTGESVTKAVRAASFSEGVSLPTNRPGAPLYLSTDSLLDLALQRMANF